jgi:DinB superfamily
MESQPERTLQDVVDAMGELRAKVRTLPSDAAGLKPTPDDWTIGQILMHVAMSHRFSADQIEYARRNQPIESSYFDPNRALMAEAPSQSLAEITARLESEQDRLISWLKTVPTDSWSQTYTAVLPWGTREVDVAGIGTRLKAHYADHLQQIEDWLARSSVQRA